MPSLPTVGASTDTWGTELNAYLTVGHNTDGTPKGASFEYQLAGNTAAGTSTITLDRTPAFPVTIQKFLLIDAGTSQAEIRKLNANPSGAVCTLTAPLTYAHTANDAVLVISQGALATSMWGCVADGGVNDHDALQEAIYQCAVYGLGIWLDGQNRTHLTQSPLIIPSQAKLRNLSIKAGTSFTPAETNNAMLMAQSGNIFPFTAGTDDIIHCTGHGIPADSVGVVFQGSSLPTGLTAGKFYYSRDRTTDTFKVSATAGGAAVDITSSGSGTAYCEVYSTNAKCQFENCYFQGALSVSGLNGILMSVQQPGYANTLRIDDFDGYGLKLKGQQYVMYNLESIGCRKALVLADMSFLWVFGYNAEGCDNAIYTEPPTGAFSCSFYGCHFEMNVGSYSTASSIAVYLDAGAQNFTMTNVHHSSNGATATFMKVDTGGAANSGYTLQGIEWSGGATSTGQIFLNDVDRGISLDNWDDLRHFLYHAIAPTLPASQAYDDPSPILYLGSADRRIAMGSQNDDQASMRLRPGNSQTADNIRIDDVSGNRVSGFNKGGVFFTQRNSAPADGDLVAGEMALWFDSTNGASKLMVKAKQADGTVKTGNVALA